VHGCLTGLVLAVSAEIGNILIGHNFHEIAPGAIYRCSQPSPEFLEQTIKTYGIRTVINLRGCCDPVPWYLDQCRVTNRLDVSQEDLSFSSSRLPSVQGVRQLIEILDRTEYPILVHCHKGIDRTGLVVATALLLHTDTPLAQARRQLGPRYAHLPVGKTGNIDRFFDLYEEWLAAQGLEHSRAAFRRWATREYCPGECRCSLEVLAPREPRVPRGRPWTVTLRCRNTSVKPWRLRPGNNAGIHASYTLFNDRDENVAAGRAGLFGAEVPPGSFIDLTLALPPLKAGKYLLRVDMVDEQHASFFQTGSEPLQWALEVP
jgi:hypothetical protein